MTVYVVPGKQPVCSPGGIPSKGALTEYHHVYDLGHPGNVLVIGESGPGQLAGSIDFTMWDVRENRVRTLQCWAGEEDGRDLCHEMRQSESGPELAIHGFYPAKRANKAYEKDRVSLEDALGIPVELVYDGNAD